MAPVPVSKDHRKELLRGKTGAIEGGDLGLQTKWRHFPSPPQKDNNPGRRGISPHQLLLIPRCRWFLTSSFEGGGMLMGMQF